MEFIRKNVNGSSSTSTGSSGGGYVSVSGGKGVLETHTIFSQPFNGTNDVKGDLADVNNITANGKVITDVGFVIKGTDEEGYYNEKDFTVTLNDSNIQFEGATEYVYDTNVKAPTFTGNVDAESITATTATISNIDATNVGVEEDIQVAGDIYVKGNITTESSLNIIGDYELNISVDKEGTKFEDGFDYYFDGGVYTNQIEANEGNISDLTSESIYTEYLSADIADFWDSVNTNEFYALFADIKKLISENIEVDNLTVKKAAHFFKLIIDEIKSVGGQIIISPANATFDLVEMDGGYYKCYFRAEEDGKQIDNQFETDDQVVCQTFNITEGENNLVSNKFYWRLVVDKGSEERNGIKYHYIVLSDVDKDIYSNAAPTKGDKVALLGNKTDESRQNAIIISAYSSAFLDSGIDAPFIVQYKGINNYTLSTHRHNVISNGLNLFKGDFILTSGEDVSGQLSEIKATAEDINLFVQQPNNINMFEGSNGYNYGCWKVFSVSVSPKSGTNYILVLGGSNNGGYILQPSKYFVTTNKVNVSLDVSELQGLSSYYSMEICDKDGTVISNKVNLGTGNNTYAFTLTKIPNNIIHLKISLVAGSRLAFRNEKALLQTVPKRISQIEIDVDSITSRVSNAEGNITQIQQTANELSVAVSNIEGDISQINQTANSLATSISNIEGDISTIEQTSSNLTTRITNVEGDVSNVTQRAEEINSLVTNLQGDISEVSQKADGLVSRVGTVEGNITQINQNANEIETQISSINGSISNVSQKADQIASRVTVAEGSISQVIQKANTLTSRISSVEGSISEVSQKADLIESKIISEDVINSKISQTTSNIKAEVFNELNESTGIDISTGTITLNADKTIFNGNINMRNPEEGIVVYDDLGNATILVQNKKIPTLSNLDQPSYTYFVNEQFSTINEGKYFLSEPYKIGKAKVGDNIEIMYNTLYFAYKESETIGKVPLSTTSYLEYFYVLRNTTTGKYFNSAKAFLQSNPTGFDASLNGATFAITEDGDYEVILNLTFIQPTTYTQYLLKWGSYLMKNISQYTQIGTDGIISVQDEGKFLYFGSDGFEVRNAPLIGIRVGPKVQQVLAECDGVTLWTSLTSKTNVKVNPISTSMEVIAANTSMGTKNVVRADYEYYDVDTFIFQYLNEEVWIKLPEGNMTIDGKLFQTTPGRVIKIRNLTNYGCYVYVSGSQSKIYPSISDNTSTSYYNLGNTGAEFVWIGSDWVRTH